LALTACAPLSSLGFDDAATYQCLEHTIDGEVLAAATPVGDLTGEAATMLSEAQHDDGTPLVLDDEEAWYFAGLSDESLLIMRNLDAGEADGYGPPGSDREVIQVSRLEGAPNAADGWYVTAQSVCPLTVDLGSLAVPTVQLDPAHVANADSTELQLLVTETDCNSGQAADGRVKLVSLKETADTVTVTIGVKPRGGNNTCPGNPATPFTVTLDDPLGDRTIIDGTRGLPMTTP